MNRLLIEVTEWTVSNVNVNVSYAFSIKWRLIVGKKFGFKYSLPENDGTVNELGLIHLYSSICVPGFKKQKLVLNNLI